MDETGFYQRQTYARSWSPVGEACYDKVDASKGKRLNLIGAISLSSFSIITVIYLPPYSPELNPIELFWAVLKQKVRLVFPSYESLDDCINDCLL